MKWKNSMPINFSSTISKILNSKTPTVGVCVCVYKYRIWVSTSHESKAFRQIDSIFQAFGFGFYLLGVF